MKIKGICPNCGEVKLFLRRRTYFCKSINLQVTSDIEMCTKCFKKIKSMVI